MADSTGLAPGERNAAILGALGAAHLHSILFVTHTAEDGGRVELIRAWGREGHGIGNHTATHPSLDAVPLVEFEQDFLAADKALRGLPGFVRRFRFPYLKEGDTAAKRDGFRAFLREHGYAAGPVSVDASDWYYSQRLAARLKAEPGADTSRYREAYLDHLIDRAEYYDGLSRRVLGRSVAHVLLLHHNLINALFLKDVIARFSARGWTLVDANVAFADPVYARLPVTLPAGESVLWALAREKGITGLRFPGEDERYEKPILDRLGL